MVRGRWCCWAFFILFCWFLSFYFHFCFFCLSPGELTQLRFYLPWVLLVPTTPASSQKGSSSVELTHSASESSLVKPGVRRFGFMKAVLGLLGWGRWFLCHPSALYNNTITAPSFLLHTGLCGNSALDVGVGIYTYPRPWFYIQTHVSFHAVAFTARRLGQRSAFPAI